MNGSAREQCAFRLILHIGTNKTGTSAIQHFFYVRRKELLKHGILYPKAGCSGNNHHALSRLLGFGPPLGIDRATRARKLAEIKQSLLSEIAGGAPRAVVISSENFMLPRSIEPVLEFFDGFDVRVLVYLRRHDQWRESAYSQGLRMVSNPPWEWGFLGWLGFQERSNNKYGNYRWLLDGWAGAFGKESLIVRPYEKQQNQPDIITDFLRAVSLDEVVDKIDLNVPRVNESLSMKAMSLLETFQRMEVSPEQRKLLVKHACSLAPDREKKSMVPPLLRRKLVAENQADYEYIAHEYLGREDGCLFYDPLPDPDETWRPLEPLAADEVELEKEFALRGKKLWGLLK